MDYRAVGSHQWVYKNLKKKHTQLFRIDVFLLFLSTACCWQYKPKHAADGKMCE